MAIGQRKPLQIYLRPDQEDALRALAKQRHVSMAELIRRGIDRFLLELVPPEQDPSLELIGLGASGRPDLSEHHDEIVASRSTVRPRV